MTFPPDSSGRDTSFGRTHTGSTRTSEGALRYPHQYIRQQQQKKKRGTADGEPLSPPPRPRTHHTLRGQIYPRKTPGSRGLNERKGGEGSGAIEALREARPCSLRTLPSLCEPQQSLKREAAAGRSSPRPPPSLSPTPPSPDLELPLPQTA